MEKPTHILTKLEAEPIVFAGCNNSEINYVMRRSTMIGFLSSIVISFLISFFGLRAVFYVFAFFVTFLIVTGVVGFFLIKNIARKRAGKPLFYDKHLAIYQNKKIFYHPPKEFQIERRLETPSIGHKKMMEKNKEHRDGTENEN